MKKLAAGTNEDTQDRLKKAAIELSQSIKDLLAESKDLFKDVENPMLVNKTLAVVGRMETVTQQLITELGDATCLLDLRFGSKMACLNALHLQGEVSFDLCLFLHLLGRQDCGCLR